VGEEEGVEECWELRERWLGIALEQH